MMSNIRVQAIQTEQLPELDGQAETRSTCHTEMIVSIRRWWLESDEDRIEG
jgi:hypothetical protein